jgi:hypothetical protein
MRVPVENHSPLRHGEHGGISSRVVFILCAAEMDFNFLVGRRLRDNGTVRRASFAVPSLL